MSEEGPPWTPLGLWVHTCSHVFSVTCSLALVLLLQRGALTPLAWIPATAWEWPLLLNVNIYVNLNSKDLAFTLGFWILIGFYCSQNKVQIFSPIFQGLSHLIPSYVPLLVFLENLQTPFALSGWTLGVLCYSLPSEWNAGTPISLRPQPTSSMKSSWQLQVGVAPFLVNSYSPISASPRAHITFYFLPLLNMQQAKMLRCRSFQQKESLFARQSS